MKVAIDTGPLTSGDKIRGVGFYTRHLIEEIERDARRDKNFEFESLDLDTIKKRASQFDVIHVPYFNPHFLTIPKSGKAKIIVTIHDTISLLYPKHYPPGVRGRIRFLKQKARLRHVDAVITDSESSKKDIVRFLGIPQKKVFSIHLAPAKHFRKLKIGDWRLEIRKKFKLPNRFVLYVGDINYNKNIPTLLEACNLANIPLVIVGKQAKEVDIFDTDIHHLGGPRDWIRYLFGKPHPEVAHYKEILSLFRKSKDSLRLGFVSDRDLVKIYNLATVYCQPSYAEGFGLPVLEAMACGVAVVASRCQCLVEIAEGSALFADPNDPIDFVNKIRRIIKNSSLKNKLIKNGLENVKKYSWEKTARETIEIYKSVL